MMKIKYALWASLLALGGCEKLSQGTDIPEPSTEQSQVAQQAYDDLRSQNFDHLMKNFEPELQARYKGNEKAMQKFARGLPQENYKTKKIVSKKFLNEPNQASKYTVTYEYAYDKNLVQYDVSFDKPNGSAKIRDISVSVFGEKI